MCNKSRLEKAFRQPDAVWGGPWGASTGRTLIRPLDARPTRGRVARTQCQGSPSGFSRDSCIRRHLARGGRFGSAQDNEDVTLFLEGQSTVHYGRVRGIPREPCHEAATHSAGIPPPLP